MSVTAARGFVAAGVHAGIRASQPDLAVVRSTAPAVGAAMFTRNRVQAAPLVVSKAHLAETAPQAIVINSGVANAATGARGELDAIATAAEVALFHDGATGTAIVICAIDNLGKGAAGQAVQNANLMLGLPETAGLSANGIAP